MSIAQQIAEYKPCDDFVKWINAFEQLSWRDINLPDRVSDKLHTRLFPALNLGQVWRMCPNGNWMSRVLGNWAHQSNNVVGLRSLVDAELDCAELLLDHIRVTPQRKTIADGRKWTNGELSEYALWIAIFEARNDLNSHELCGRIVMLPSLAVLNAISTAIDPIHSGGAASYLSELRHKLAPPESANTAYVEALLQCADIVRKYFPTPPWEST